MEEVFKDIPNYEGLYQASNLGRIKSLARISLKNAKLQDRILKQALNKTGYYSVALHKDNKHCNMNHISTSSKYVGVSFYKKKRKWQASIFINGKANHLGMFENEIDASEAYQKKLKEFSE